MTKREARKIATLRTAKVLQQDDTLWSDEAIPIEDSHKIADQQKGIAEALAGRYDLELSDIPNSTIRIANSVVDGSL